MQKKEVYEVKIADSINEINDCKVLLHKTYISHYHWTFQEYNPSNLQIKRINGKLALTDDYDCLSVWFTVRLNTKIVACARICSQDNNGLLEVERYTNAANSLNSLLTQKNNMNILEFNREAVLPTLQHDNRIYLLLIRATLEYVIEKKCTIITTCNMKNWVQIYNYLAFPIYLSPTFKYFDSEIEPVKTYYINQSTAIILLEKINFNLSKSFVKKTVKLLSTG